MKKTCDPYIGDPEVQMKFSRWRKTPCFEKLKHWEKPLLENIQEYFSEKVKNSSGKDQECYVHAYSLVSKCLNETEVDRKTWLRKQMGHRLESKYKNILVLGMMGIEPDQYDAKKVKGYSTYPPPLRDYNRLVQLQEAFPDAVIYTLNLEPIEGIRVKPTHTFTSITRRGAQKLADTFPTVQFDLVLLDYFRFPKTYMTNAYGKICDPSGFLFTLAQNQMLSPQVEIYIPHLSANKAFCEDVKKPWRLDSVDASQNPLAQATATLEKKTSDLLGGYHNKTELSLLQHEYPFQKLTFRK